MKCDDSGVTRGVINKSKDVMRGKSNKLGYRVVWNRGNKGGGRDSIAVM